MNSNLFERKNFLAESLINTSITEYFSTNILNEKIVVKVNLLRATANESDSLKKYLAKISSNKFQTVIIDLSDSNFIDSTFLSGIIRYNKSTQAQIKLVVEDNRQLTIFRITKLDSLFKIYSNLNQALAS